jgi:hypothetical protein
MRILAAHTLALVMATCVLASCASHTERATARATTDDDKCRSYGFIAGSDGYAQCRMAMDIQRQQACQAAQNNVQAAQNRMAQEPAVSPFEAVGPMLGVANACR